VEVAAGRVLFTASGSTFGGGVTVKAGATAVAGATYEIITATSASGPFGIFALNNAMGKVFIEEGGRVDLNGFNGLGYMFTLAGDDAYVNLGDPLNIGTSAVAVNWRVPWQAYGWTLAADVALGVTGTQVGIVSDNYNDSYLYKCMLNLGSHTLTKTGMGTLWFWTGELAVSGAGTLAIDAGVVDIRKGMYNGASSTVTVGADTVLRLDAGMKVRSLVNNGTIDSCHVVFSMMETIGTGKNLGGICGLNKGIISKCITEGNVWGGGVRDYAGGICGTNEGGTLSGNTTAAICGSGSDATLPEVASEQ